MIAWTQIGETHVAEVAGRRGWVSPSDGRWSWCAQGEQTELGAARRQDLLDDAGAGLGERTTVVAVGLAGTILRSADAGATWGAVTSPTTEALRAVHRSPSGRWTACGDGGVIVQSLDDGVTWTLRTNDDVNDLFAAGSDWPLGRAVVGGEARTLILE